MPVPMTRPGSPGRRTVACLLSIAAFATGAEPTAQQVREARKAAADRYLQYTQAARDHVLTPASCPFSPASIVMLVGTEPEALAGYVRKLGYEPYAGVVRGAEGTLASRAGGDWDRAVLLQALLTEAGFQSQLKIVKRTPEEADAAIDAFLKQQAIVADWYGGMRDAPAAADKPSKFAQAIGIETGNRRIYEAQDRARLGRLVGEALDAASYEAPHLLSALTPAGKPGQPFDAWRQSLRAGAAERVEVSVALSEGEKVFSVAPEAQPVPADRLANAEAFETAPPDRIATLRVQLSFTRSDKDQPAGEPVALLDQTSELGSLFRRPLRLEVVPSDEAAAAKPVASWTKDEWHKYVSNFKQFQAILRTGDEWAGSKVFDLSGTVMSVAADGRVENASEIGSAVGGTMGGLLGGGGNEKPAAPTSRLEHILLTLTLALPGQEPRTQQRLLYGREMAGVTPVFTADMSASAGPVSTHAMSWLLLDAVTRNAPLVARLVTGDSPKRFEQTEDAKRLPMMLYDWQMLRLMAAQRLMEKNPGLTLTGGPSLLLHSVRIATDATQKNVATRHAIDVAFDDALLLPRNADAAAEAGRANMMLGIASTVLESALLRRIDPALGATGAFSAFEEARAAGQNSLSLAAGADATAIKPPPLVAWSLARNEPGRTLVFPHAQSPSDWWSVDRATGATIGRGDGGEGQSAMEYLQITKKNVENLKCMVGMSNQILGGSSSSDTAQQWFLCMTGTDNSGSGHGIPGAVEGGMQSDFKVSERLDIGIGPVADALGGAKDLYDYMNGPNPILYTGR